MHLPRHSLHQRRTTGNGFAVMPVIVKPHIQVPPVVEQGDEVRHDAARREFVRRVATPAPLIFEFVVVVLSVATISILLGHAEGGIATLSNEVINTAIRPLHGATL